jgi:hypothetical protein
MKLAFEDPHVEKATRPVGKPGAQLEKPLPVLDVMEDAAGGPKALLAEARLLDKNGIGLFKRTANSWRALGPDVTPRQAWLQQRRM